MLTPCITGRRGVLGWPRQVQVWPQEDGEGAEADMSGQLAMQPVIGESQSKHASFR
jgi:hypothetical protein